MRQTLHLTKCALIFVFLLGCQHSFSQDKTGTADADTVFEKVEVQATFPGGNAAWNKYVYDAMKKVDFFSWKNKDMGICRIRFIVDKNGNISNVHAVNMKKTRLAKFGIRVMKEGPRWTPAMQNGKPVNAYREQSVGYKAEKQTITIPYRILD